MQFPWHFTCRPEGLQRWLLHSGFSPFMAPALHLWTAQILVAEVILLTCMWLKCLCIVIEVSRYPWLLWCIFATTLLGPKLYIQKNRDHLISLIKFIKVILSARLNTKYMVRSAKESVYCIVCVCFLDFIFPNYHAIFCTCFYF